MVPRSSMFYLLRKTARPLIRYIRYFYDGWVHLLADIDGVRLITNDVCEFLQKVPGKLLFSTASRSILAHSPQM